MGYNEDKEPDSRIAHIKATSLTAEAAPDPVPCPECDGFGEVVIKNEDGVAVGRRPCEKCEGTGAVL